ncbi:hypothetical protein LY90DRAFT_519793 [Neocallimastix californiae]|uniref:Uncharacterized protein n=1 Tax=Neocallimastix californiae TaxID=1754190 RepID=A0A1Y1YRY3_9FUNG|nr:hypothetical protein LY90DRAFT_519793 [Neocallimastix californiae]|eukprot:ORY00729.1 hypothetical protein LY90DRAFT_519793 [Neocallimastix californiae]
MNYNGRNKKIKNRKPHLYLKLYKKPNPNSRKNYKKFISNDTKNVDKIKNLACVTMNHTIGNHKDFSKNLLSTSKFKIEIQDEFNSNYFNYPLYSNNNEINNYSIDKDKHKVFKTTDYEKDLEKIPSENILDSKNIITTPCLIGVARTLIDRTIQKTKGTG